MEGSLAYKKRELVVVPLLVTSVVVFERGKQQIIEREAWDSLVMANVKAVTVILIAVWSSHMLHTVYGAGECGSTPISTVALSLSPCIGAASNARASVPASCCTQVRNALAMPACLCAVFLSPIARQAGINPAIAITIPKRCNIANRPAGKRCGSYIVP